MAHSDNNGLVLPPKLAPIQVVIVPIYKKEEEFTKISERALEIKKKLEKLNVSVKYDDRDTHKPGFKFAEHELKGVPVRIAIGPRDYENNTVEIARRDTLEKRIYPVDGVDKVIGDLMGEIQQNIYNKALRFREDNTHHVESYKEFKEVLDSKGGFIYAHWDGTSETEMKVKQETKATIRCIPFEDNPTGGKCMVTGKPSKQKVLFARAY